MADQAQVDIPPDVLEEVQESLSIREAVLDVLLEKVENDRYPSPTMLDDIERLLTPGRREDYAEVLLDKVRTDRFPSHSLIERLLRLPG